MRKTHLLPSLRLTSIPKHLRAMEAPEFWSLELLRPSGSRTCVLTIDLYANEPAPGREAHYGHWGYIIEAAHDKYRIEFLQAGENIALSLNGQSLDVHKRDWFSPGENGFYIWEVGWKEAGAADHAHAKISRGQALMFSPVAHEVSFLLASWPDADRRDPGLDNMARRILLRLRQEIEALAAALPENARVLDFGCGNKPYYPFFHTTCSEYVGVDIAQGLLVDTIFDGSVDLPDEYFDFAICTQVLEHTRDPFKISSELWRLLKPHGTAFISAPFCWHYHPWPNDYWRFTAEGLKVLFEQFSGFRSDIDCLSLHTLLQEFGFLLSRAGYSGQDALRLLNDIGNSASLLNDDKLPSHHLIWLTK